MVLVIAAVIRACQSVVIQLLAFLRNDLLLRLQRLNDLHDAWPAVHFQITGRCLINVRTDVFQLGLAALAAQNLPADAVPAGFLVLPGCIARLLLKRFLIQEPYDGEHPAKAFDLLPDLFPGHLYHVLFPLHHIRHIRLPLILPGIFPRIRLM